MAKKYYAVRVGREPGIYSSWDECQEQTKGFPKAKFAGFDFLSEAKQYLAGIEIKADKGQVAAEPDDPFANKTIPPIEIENLTSEKTQPFKLPEEVTIWTDGAKFASDTIENSSNDGPDRGPGGYAAVFVDKEEHELLRLQGGSQLTTNNKMRLTAIKDALLQLEDGTKHKVQIKSDSKYAVSSFEKNWVRGWKARATKIGDEVIWHKSDGPVVANQDILKEIDRIKQHHDVRLQHTTGHSGIPLNRLCDELVKEMSKQMIKAKNFEIKRKNDEQIKDTKETTPKGIKIQRNSGRDSSNSR